VSGLIDGWVTKLADIAAERISYFVCQELIELTLRSGSLFSAPYYPFHNNLPFHNAANT
jgi:hypothetical protein